MWQGERTVQPRACSCTTKLAAWPEAILITTATKTYSNYRCGFSAFTCGINRHASKNNKKKRGSDGLRLFFFLLRSHLLFNIITYF
jgi:hypothetical protein